MAVSAESLLRIFSGNTDIFFEKYSVHVTFSDNSENRFDLVIGTDGVNSKTRKLVFGEGFEKYLDVAYFAFIAPNRTKNQFQVSMIL